MSLAIFLRKRMANLRRIYVATFHRKHLAVYSGAGNVSPTRRVAFAARCYRGSYAGAQRTAPSTKL
jgi:hypothetical protein